MKDKSNRRITWVRWLPGFLISVLALGILLRVANWNGIGEALVAYRWPFIAGSLLLTLAFLWARAMAWAALLEGRARPVQTFWAINQGYLINNLLPLRAGELGRAVLLGQQINLSPVHILSTVVIERIVDLAFAALLLLSTLPLVVGMAWARTVSWLTLGVILLSMLILTQVARHQEATLHLFERVTRRWRWRALQEMILPQVRTLMDGLGALRSPASLWKVMFWIAVSWGLAVCNYYLMLLPIAPHARFWWGVFADGVLAMGIALPSAPAALGTFEAALVGALALLGVDSTPALAYAITLHFLQFMTTGLLGVLGLLRQRRSLQGWTQWLRLRERREPIP
ncbi:lysylphosphatidylglycerol synthase transmembrane domain-containing protein [uncultured Thermanaerothrix sp.]|uniref:lysylphosphatidylglycerol synthase transmembrane domain-containing protein n=1 Tax=uncultured Thermanaerothrix sp. TaxID=1195149 RepID=UPI00262946C9|nr:lysylphosphatidylglycerol synthase transmembrane domain-containing protein [uncultured Thermanaerothrix sp.]